MARQTGDPQLPVISSPYYFGGSSIDYKLGTPSSFYSSEAIDFRSVPSQMSVLPGATSLTTSLNGLITAMEQDLNGVRYGVDTTGWLYKIDTSDVFTPLHQMTSAGASGMLYNSITDQLYIPSQNAISLYGKLTSSISSAVWRPDQFGASASNAPGCVNIYNTSDGLFDGATRNNSQGITTGITSSSQVTTNTTLTTAVPTTLTENTTDLCFFNPDIEPFYSIDVFIKAKGTGDWTLTLHDSLNNVLATVTVVNASLTNNAYNRFLFTGQIRALVNATQTGQSASYHWHVTSTVADGTVGSITAGDMTSADFLLYAYALVAPNNGLHPTTMFSGNGVPFLCIGNGNYLTTYNFGNDSNPSNSQLVRHQLYFKPGEEVCAIDTNNQYLVIATERRTKVAGRNFQKGCLYFWDSTVNAPNFKIDIPMGAPYSVHTENSVTYFECAGSLYAWSGGQTVIKVRKLAYENTDYLNSVDNTLVYPNMFTSRYGLLMMGYPSTTSNVNTNFGVWSWGTVELTYPNSYGLSYELSNGLQKYTSGNNLQMGCVYNFVDTMYISWGAIINGVQTYGMDRVNNYSTPALKWGYRSLIWDGGVTYKQKRGARMKVRCLPLPAGCTLQAFYSADRGVDVISPTAVEGDRAIVFEATVRCAELQWGFIGTCTSGVTVAPVILDVSMQLDPLTQEEDMRKDEVNSITGTI
jgi:hypothetical protein